VRAADRIRIVKMNAEVPADAPQAERAAGGSQTEAQR
jgi:hypothetical protein